MTVLGNTSDPTWGFNQSATYNQVSPHTNALTTPAQVIKVTKLWAYFGGTSGTVGGCKLCIWKTDGTLLYASQTFTAPNGRQWASVVPNTLVLLDPSTSIYVGFWTPSGASIEWGIRSSGKWQGKQNQSSVSSMSGATEPGSPYTQGEAGGYLEYGPAGGLSFASGGSFAKYALKRYNTNAAIGATAFLRHPLKRYDNASSSWKWFA